MNEPSSLLERLSEEAVWRLEEACCRFEEAWRAGQRPALEDFVAESEGEERLALLRELLRLEVYYRRRAGEGPSAADYETRFPEATAVLREVFASPAGPDRPPVAPEPEADDPERTSADEGHPLKAGRAGFGADVGPPRSPADAGSTGVGLSSSAGGADDADLGRPLPGAPPADLPRDVGRYRVVGEIGQGGMGIVFRGRDPALKRTLAIKVLLDKYRGHADVERRFLEEVQITAQLQHPGVPPVHEVGRLDDGRPFFAMKLVQGRTLAELLKERRDLAEDLPHFLAVCQTLAYAHSRGIIHRDLKPSNIMVGAFGEVQVMDWGLAKLLAREGPAPAEEPSTVFTVRTAAAPLSQAGTVIGTLAYMAPEQARAEAHLVDERADVFGLGALLCVLLTGQPPYPGADRAWVYHQAARADLVDAFARLDACGADAELVRLAKGCMARDREGRPRDAGEVARAVEAYQAGVKERLRRAEVERAAAESRAEEEKRTRQVAEAKVALERRARRLTAGLAASVLLFVVAGGSAAWLVQKQRAEAAEQQRETDRQVRPALERARTLLDEGWSENDTVKLTAAVAEADKAAEIARRGGASDDVHQEADALRKQAREKVDRARKNVVLLAALLNVTAPRETRRYERSEAGTMMALADPSVEEQFREAFHRWDPDLDIDHTPLETLVARLGDQPKTVIQEIVAGLDTWMLDRRRKGPADGWQRLFRLAEKLDRDTASGELRLLVVSGELEREAAVSALARRLMPWSALVEAPPGKHTQRLRKLAAAARPRGPVLGLVALARALDGVGDAKQADRLLRAAVTAQPDQVVLLDARGKLLERQGPAHRPEAISCYRAVRAVRPLLGIALGMALLNEGRPAEAEEVFVDLRDRQRNNPEMSFYLGKALYEQKKLDEAATAFRKAVALQPDYALAHYGLGAALADQNKLAEAVAAFRKAIHLKSDFAYAYIYLGIALRKQKKLDEAVACYQQAIALQPDYALAYSNLGIVLRAQQKLDEAVAACRRAIQLQPDFADAYNNLGAALADQKKFDEAADAFRKAIQLQPDFAMAYNNLGAYLCDHQKKPAEAESLFRKAIALQPDLALAYYNLGNALRHQKKLVEAVAAYRRAIELQPDFAFPYANLGLALRDQKKLVEASTAFRKAHQLLPNDSRIRDDLHQTERWLELDKQLPLILAGKAKPSSPQGQMELALFCLDFKARYRAAVGFYAEAFATKPELADDLQAQHRYNAACAAALAAAGQGEDARRLPDKVILTLRRQALRWLRAELAAYARLAERDDPRLKQAVRQRLTHWQQDADLASVRDKEALDRLPHNEGGRWRKLWADVDMLLRKTQVIPR